MIEVIVALAVASSALIVLLSACNNALRKSLQAREEGRIEAACEEVVGKIGLEDEKGLRGALPGCPGWSWEMADTPAGYPRLKGLRRIIFQAFGPEGFAHPARQFVFFRYELQGGRRSLVRE